MRQVHRLGGDRGGGRGGGACVCVPLVLEVLLVAGSADGCVSSPDCKRLAHWALTSRPCPLRGSLTAGAREVRHPLPCVRT